MNDAARQQMITQQVRAGAVLDADVLQVMAEVPRERFVPPAFRRLAFADTAVPLPGGQEMLTPQVTGRILQALAIGKADRILEIGTGSGFLTACLARLGAQVTSLEIRHELADAARRALHDTRSSNCEVLAQDAFAWQPPGTFDCIAVTGSLPLPDTRFQEWLAPGGRMFVVVGQPPAMEAWLLKREAHGAVLGTSLFETCLPPLDHAPRPDSFAF